MPYDMCAFVPVEGIEGLDRALDTAKELGWSGLCIFSNRTEIKAAKDIIMKAKPSLKGIDVPTGLLLEPRSKSELKRQVASNRKNYEAIAVRPNSPDTCRAAAETAGVDMIVGWESAVVGAGQPAHQRVIDYVTVKLAAENGVSIAFSLQPLLAAYDRARAGIMAKYLEAVRFVRKYKTPFILTSGALSAMDLRAPSELTAFGKVLGFNGRDIKQALSGQLLAENRKRLGKKWVMPGVEVE